MGEFMEFDPNYRSSFMRMRVRLDSTRPLLRGRILDLDKQKDTIWVSFRYERLTKFCYFCGHLDHIQKDCAALLEEQESGNIPFLQYDVSLKTISLAHTTSSNTRMVQSVNKKCMAQFVLEAARTLTKKSNMEYPAKRLKVGNTSSSYSIGESNENEATIQNTKKMDVKGGEINNLPNPAKSAIKGITAALKHPGGVQKDPSVK